VQIEEGNRHIEKLKIENLTLKNISITDINKDLGKFDYIIVHGVFSWVPKDVQEKILAICNENLSANGVAYVSYNTLPGWNTIKSIREMMLYHTRKFEQPAEKVIQARLLLDFIKNSADKNSVYSEVIQSEIEILKSASDSYLFHDHLEENNDPVYFHQFVEGAISNGLQYIADTDIASMFAGNFAKGTADILMQASDDAVRIEQYMDFVRNRRFRSSLLCHKNVVLNKVLRPDSIGDLYVTWNLETDRDFKDIDFTKNENVTFTRKGYNFSFTTNNSIVIAALLYIIEKNTLVSVKSIITETKKRLGSKANAEAVEKVVKETLLRLVLAGMQISAFAPNYATKLSDKPKASSLARYQATYLPWVTSEKLQKVNVDLFARVMCQYLNGENDFDAIVANMVKHVVNNDLALNQDGKKVTDKKQIEANVRNMSREILEKFVPNGLLVA
ncbi:MAG: hypothetical protein K0R98_1097, partial [Rickettsiaceae bacterium]|nr:hypothetical protein [Rickettsiaceae bacterium]